jgi:hypothetical protein
MKTTLLFTLAWLCSLSLQAQVYLEEQNQHRFAQTHVGLHYRYQPEGGKSSGRGRMVWNPVHFLLLAPHKSA